MAVGVYPAEVAELPRLLEFAEQTLEMGDCPMNVSMRLCIVLEEVFVNICNYAYPEGPGEVALFLEPGENSVTIRFEDTGVPFDPLAKAEADPQAMAETEKVGGLGIHIVRQTMDRLSYRYADGKNILTMEKRW